MGWTPRGCLGVILALTLLSQVKAQDTLDREVYSGYEDKLVEDLLRTYSTYVRPVKNETQIIYIQYHLKLSRILKIDERNQILTTAIWLEQRWNDSYLIWDPADYDNITTINIPTTKIWIPDTVLYNSADVNKEPGTGVMMTSAIVNHHGQVFWAAPAIFHSSCKLDITFFPFDRQTCHLKFGPWAYLGNQVQMKKKSATGDFTMMTPSGQWDLLGLPVTENLVLYGCCPEPFSDVTFNLRLKRKALFYVFNLLFPSIFMSLMSLLTFYLPAESGEKLGLNITVLLSLVFFLLLGAQLLPPTSDSVSLLGQLLASIIILMSLETAMSVIILRLHHHEPRNLPPAWARRIILDKLACLLGVTGRRHEYHSDYHLPMDEENDAASLEEDPFEFDSQRALYNCESLGSSLLQKLQLELGAYTTPPPATKMKGNGQREQYDEVCPEYGSDVTEYSIGATIMRIGGYLEKLVRRSRRSEKRSIVQQQWIDMCVVLDRLLLCIFTIALLLDVSIIMYSMTTGTVLT
ncbi:neuronal acetylcholine receptor subunit alpha-10-like isoform X1 [Amphiura filiformis]|uniref:neuronal acetylcholine receptor subunit alpha-10-like isoform X1 n=1 Tax=Amphiura filiformis TaxID=82378 RepID=UPI003B21C8FE